MFQRGLFLIGRCVVHSFTAVGFCTVIAMFGMYMNSRQVPPRYNGIIYDCRQPNSGALWAACGLVGQPDYSPELYIRQYPDDRKTMISLDDSSDRTLHFIFPEIRVRLHVVRGAAPPPTSSAVQLVHQ